MLKGSLPCRNFSSLQKPFSPFFSCHWINFVLSEGSGNILFVHCSVDLSLHKKIKRFECTSGLHAAPQAPGHLQCNHETFTCSPAQSSLYMVPPDIFRTNHQWFEGWWHQRTVPSKKGLRKYTDMYPWTGRPEEPSVAECDRTLLVQYLHKFVVADPYLG